MTGRFTLRLLSGLVLLAGWLALSPAQAADDPAPVAAPVVPTVTVAPATLAVVEGRVPLSGTLVARQVVQVYPQVAGLEIEALDAEPGDRVTKGQQLALLSAATLTAQLAQADAELQRAIAGVSQAESQISSTEAARTQAVTALDRARSLRRSGSGSQAALDQAVAAEAAAQAQAASATDGLAVARAAQAQAQAARDIAQLNLDRTRIAAPVDGRVTARAAQLGGIAASGGEPMFTLIADGTVEFEGEVIENALPDLKPGDPAEVNVAGVGPIAGTVRQLPGAVDPTTRLGLVRVALPPDPRLLTGLFASGEIVTIRREGITVPATAVLADADGERVQVVKGGLVDTRHVTGGLLWQGQREILSGLAEGDQVIVRAGAFFTAGDAVKGVTEAEAAALAAAAVRGPDGVEIEAGALPSATGDQPVPPQDAAATGRVVEDAGVVAGQGGDRGVSDVGDAVGSNASASSEAIADSEVNGTAAGQAAPAAGSNSSASPGDAAASEVNDTTTGQPAPAAASDNSASPDAAAATSPEANGPAAAQANPAIPSDNSAPPQGAQP